jgi:hypothetical protein
MRPRMAALLIAGSAGLAACTADSGSYGNGAGYAGGYSYGYDAGPSYVAPPAYGYYGGGARHPCACLRQDSPQPQRPDPSRRRHRRRFQQLAQVLKQRGISDGQRMPAAARPANHTGQRARVIEVLQTTTYRAAGDPGCARRCADPAMTRRARLRRREQPTSTLIQTTANRRTPDTPIQELLGGA